ncbi:helix-turn-helix domain-containing protein [Blastochloris tepida]|uniref:Helix-turn-helix domain-containing protein n=1 Tax=Blastochloris tepida TaxID=2233851 RepID=A0A348G456_9HYPH|nr:helix-turn-helix domain-containing protein [Blastochloris tepida]BBF94339.1 hypothetical protein BLTE_30240 [Blastochloris tepida]
MRRRHDPLIRVRRRPDPAAWPSDAPITVTEAAALAGVGETSVRTAIRRGLLPSARIAGHLLVTPSGVAAWRHGPAPRTRRPGVRPVDRRAADLERLLAALAADPKS